MLGCDTRPDFIIGFKAPGLNRNERYTNYPAPRTNTESGPRVAICIKSAARQQSGETECSSGAQGGELAT